MRRRAIELAAKNGVVYIIDCLVIFGETSAVLRAGVEGWMMRTLHEVHFEYPKQILRSILDQWLPAVPQHDNLHGQDCRISFKVEKSLFSDINI